MMVNNNTWLVVSTPLKNISQLGWFFPIYGKIKHVPNHQSDTHVYIMIYHIMEITISFVSKHPSPFMLVPTETQISQTILTFITSSGFWVKFEGPVATRNTHDGSLSLAQLSNLVVKHPIFGCRCLIIIFSIYPIQSTLISSKLLQSKLKIHLKN